MIALPLEIIYGPPWVLFGFVCLFVPHNPQKRKGRFREGKRLAQAYTASLCCRLDPDVNVSRSRAVPGSVFNHCAVPIEMHASHNASDGDRGAMVKINTGKCVPGLEHCSFHIVSRLSHPQRSLLGLEENMYKVHIFCHGFKWLLLLTINSL